MPKLKWTRDGDDWVAGPFRIVKMAAPSAIRVYFNDYGVSFMGMFATIVAAKVYAQRLTDQIIKATKGGSRGRK